MNRPSIPRELRIRLRAAEQLLDSAYAVLLRRAWPYGQIDALVDAALPSRQACKGAVFMGDAKELRWHLRTFEVAAEAFARVVVDLHSHMTKEARH